MELAAYPVRERNWGCNGRLNLDLTGWDGLQPNSIQPGVPATGAPDLNAEPRP
jgi:hypothetical protein